MKELNVWAVIKFRRILKHLFNFGIGSGQKLLQHETCGLPAAGRLAGKRQPLERGRADYTRQTAEDSPLRVVLFPSLPPCVRPAAPGRSVGLSSRSVVHSVGRPLPLPPRSLPSLPFLQLLPVRSSAVGKRTGHFLCLPSRKLAK